MSIDGSMYIYSHLDVTASVGMPGKDLENFFPPASVANKSLALGIKCWSVCSTGFTVTYLKITAHSYCTI